MENLRQTLIIAALLSCIFNPVSMGEDGWVLSHQKISSTEGGFTGTLDDYDDFGTSVASLGDLDGDGVADLAVGTTGDDDGGDRHGAVWVLFLHSNGTVKSHQKISDTAGGFTGTLDDWDYFGTSVASLGDLDGDGVADLAVGATSDDDGGDRRGAVWVLFLDGARPVILAGPGPGQNNPTWVKGFDVNGNHNGTTSFTAYPGLDGYGTRLAAGDLGGNGPKEVVTGPGPGPNHPPRVRAFSGDGTPLSTVDFLAYGVNKYGVNVCCGDIDGDGFDEIVTGPGPGAVFGPHVRGWDVDGGTASGIPAVNFFAYGTKKFGVNVTCGDIDGDGFDEIVTGAGPGAVFGPHVRGFNFDNTPAVEPIPGVSFFAYGTKKFGVNLCCGDIDGDGYEEIVTGAGPGVVFGPHFRGWNYDGGTETLPIPGVSKMAYGTRKWGVRVTMGDVDADGIDEIITTPGPGAVFGPHVRGWNYDDKELESISSINFFAFDTSYRYGADAAVAGELNFQ